MPLNAGDTGYGSVPGPVPGPGVSASAGGTTETAPLLIPEPEPEPVEQWQPLSKEELEAAAGGPLWRRVRCYLVLLFWLAWVAILATAIAIIAMSPRPVAMPLKWWQKTVFYELQPDSYMELPQGLNVLCEQLPYLKSLGFGTLILQGLLKDKEVSASNLSVAAQSLATLPQIQHLLTESNKAGLKVMLDVCGVGLNSAGINQSLSSTAEQHSLRFWLEQGVAGFAICDTDAAYSEKTLLEWRGVLMEFSSQEEEERIVVLKQTGDVLLPLNISDQINRTLVDVVMRPVLPSSRHLLSAQEVADAIETHLQTKDEKLWPSWTIGGEASHDLKKLLLVLTMTLPGSPALHYDEDIDQTQDKERGMHSAAALFTSLSHSRAREEALMYGSFTFLPFNTSSNSSSSSSNSSSSSSNSSSSSSNSSSSSSNSSSSSSNSSSSSSNATLPSPSPPAVLAFLRSWGCVHFLILLNVGPEPHVLDPAWAPRLPEAGVFVTSSGLDRLGSTSLHTLVLQPHEAIVIKLFETGSYS